MAGGCDLGGRRSRSAHDLGRRGSVGEGDDDVVPASAQRRGADCVIAAGTVDGHAGRRRTGPSRPRSGRAGTFRSPTPTALLRAWLLPASLRLRSRMLFAFVSPLRCECLSGRQSRPLRDSYGFEAISQAGRSRPPQEAGPWYHFGTDRYVQCVQIVQPRGRWGRRGRRIDASTLSLSAGGRAAPVQIQSPRFFGCHRDGRLAK